VLKPVEEEGGDVSRTSSGAIKQKGLEYDTDNDEAGGKDGEDDSEEVE
jgi:hypothetical protein